ncbi:MAG: exodeoxyribonuclease VII large subunit [Anaerolineae bacterium]
MFELAPSGNPVFSVSELTAYLRTTLLQDPALQDLWVRGEVSNATLSRGGHLFFSLKDAGALVKSVAFAPLSYRLRSVVMDGQEVLAHGHLDVYMQQGIYQLYVDEVLPIGVGLAYLEFERVKRLLEGEGLFRQERKRPLPQFPMRVGVVTSAYGAARRDIENVIANRWPCTEILLAPTSVQGDGAAAEIVAALGMIAAQPVDVVIVARGGGAKEDLSCFNDEQVARLIAAMPVPVITGIGHETDFTIADFVADYRAPTPSAAAAAAVPDGSEVLDAIASLQGRLVGALSDIIAARRLQLSHFWRMLGRLSPQYSLAMSQLALSEQASRLYVTTERAVLQRRHQCDAAVARLHACSPRLDAARDRVAAGLTAVARTMQASLRWRRQELQNLSKRLSTLDPTATLARGYAIVRRRDLFRTVVTSAGSLRQGEMLDLQFHDGEAVASVAQARQDLGYKESKASRG